MSSFYFKSTQREIHHPNDDPGQREIAEKGKRRWDRGEMKFESEAEKRDYLHSVNSNKFNVLGYPAWYPAERIVAGFANGSTNCVACGNLNLGEPCMYCGYESVKCPACKSHLREFEEYGKRYCRDCYSPVPRKIMNDLRNNRGIFRYFQ